MWNWGVFLLSAIVLAGCASPLRLNQTQVIGSHNSYKMAIDQELLTQIALTNSALAAGLDYSHPDLETQLDLGLRKLELDVFYDPMGGRFQSPAGLKLIASPGAFENEGLKRPGFKVMHIQDIDFRSHCLDLQSCINQIMNWSHSQPNHTPVFITINVKDDKIDLPGFVQPLPFDDIAWVQLDAVFTDGFGEKLFTPDEFRGEYDNLPDAVRRGWPTLDTMRGRFIVVLDHADEKLGSYVEGHSALRGRAMFVNAPAEADEAAILIINDPIAEFEKIQALVQRGYIVRTRADADTREARNNDTRRRESAFNSGAQIVSTDYYLPDVRFSDFSVEFPGGVMARCNPLLRSEPCRVD